MTQYGICTNTNDNCPKAISGEVIKILGTRSFSCPDCDSELFEITPPPPKWKKIVPYFVGGLLVLGVLYILFNKNNEDENHTAETKNVIDSIGTFDEPKDSTTISDGKKTTQTDKIKPFPVKWTRVKGSEFCVGDCVLAYSETDNLGHVRERRVENYANCCPADK